MSCLQGGEIKATSADVVSRKIWYLISAPFVTSQRDSSPGQHDLTNHFREVPQARKIKAGVLTCGEFCQRRQTQVLKRTPSQIKFVSLGTFKCTRICKTKDLSFLSSHSHFWLFQDNKMIHTLNVESPSRACKLWYTWSRVACYDFFSCWSSSQARGLLSGVQRSPDARTLGAVTTVHHRRV